MSADVEQGEQALAEALARLVRRVLPQTQGIAKLQRLSAGATLQTWSFDAIGTDNLLHTPLILRRSPGGLRANETLSLAMEASLVHRLGGQGVPVAQVVHTLEDIDALGDGFLMVRLEGETIPRKLLRGPEFAHARSVLVGQMGAALGAIHSVAVDCIPELPRRSASRAIGGMEKRLDALHRPSPVFELANRWLLDHQPDELRVNCLVHGDFRVGNLMVDEQGLRAVLDWEIAHIGDPAEDLAWVCLPPWRFGEITRPVGGLGQREDLYRSWQSATGQQVCPERVRWWQVMGSLRWGVACASMYEWFASGRDPSVERAMIARRTSENELDLLRLLASEDIHA